jgi:hypothetical protein
MSINQNKFMSGQKKEPKKSPIIFCSFTKRGVQYTVVPTVQVLYSLLEGLEIANSTLKFASTRFT